MTAGTHFLWTEKYRPRKIEDYVFQSEAHKIAFTQMVNDKSIPHLILSGIQGTGKTTLAQILINSMDIDPVDVLTINASNERGIDTFRAKVLNFAMSMPLSRFKIIHLEEANRLTPEALDAMKAFMEDVSEHVRVIFTTNHVNQITPPIRSRCHEYEFKSADPVDVTERMATILMNERIKFNLKVLDEYVAVGYPDMRKIINLLQQNSRNGVLSPITTGGDTGEWKPQLLRALENDDWADARKIVCANVSASDWEALYRFLYQNLNKSPRFKRPAQWEEAIVIIAEHLYKHTLVADPEINAAALLIRLAQIEK